MTTPELTSLLLDFFRDKLALRERHVASARHVADYEFNNTYQYIINREDTQVGWLRDVLGELGQSMADDGSSSSVASAAKAEAQTAIVSDDVRHVQAFLDKWEPRVKMMANARHRRMLGVVLGETAEHRRFFEQMLAGRNDVLGRRPTSEDTGGGVLPVRWLG